ncbi:hypothetical protein ACFYO2_14450 [Streptomyces sp. NPDC006602]
MGHGAVTAAQDAPERLRLDAGNVAELLDQAVHHMEHLRLGLNDTAE